MTQFNIYDHIVVETIKIDISVFVVYRELFAIKYLKGYNTFNTHLFVWAF